MKDLLKLVWVGLVASLNGTPGSLATVPRWYRQRKRLRSMLAAVRCAVRGLESVIWEAYASVECLSTSAAKLKAAEKDLDWQGQMLDEWCRFLVAHRMYRRSQQNFTRATNDFVASLTVAEGTVAAARSKYNDTATALSALGWLNARVAGEAPHAVFRVLSPYIVEAGSLLADARNRFARVPAEVDELAARLAEIKESPYKGETRKDV